MSLSLPGGQRRAWRGAERCVGTHPCAGAAVPPGCLLSSHPPCAASASCTVLGASMQPGSPGTLSSPGDMRLLLTHSLGATPGSMWGWEEMAHHLVPCRGHGDIARRPHPIGVSSSACNSDFLRLQERKKCQTHRLVANIPNSIVSTDT